MSMDEADIIRALIALHDGTARQGPGDDAFSLEILRRLPPLPATGTVADLGCGTGSAALLLARTLNRPVLCVDAAAAFLETLRERARDAELEPLVMPLCADMGALPDTCRLDLLWSEGAAYNLTFEGALRAWRPLMNPGGVAVISELSLFDPRPPQPVLDFWSVAYPEIGDEPTNCARAGRQGFRVLFTERLPTAAWWNNYYGPLLDRMDRFRSTPDPVMQQVIADMQTELDLFRVHSGSFGYTFYVLQAADISA